MIKSLIFTFSFLFLISLFSNSQSFDYKNRLIKTDEDLRYCSFYFFSYENNTSLSSQRGTSYFFYSKKINKLFLVTNIHLLKQIEKIGVFIAKKDTNGNPDNSKILQFSIFTKNRMLHENENDLCLIDLTDYTDTLSKYYFKCFNEDNIPCKKENENFSFKDDLYCIGYSYSLIDINNGLPIVLKGSLATLPKFDFMNQKQFVINCSNRQGSSGSPIVLNKKNKYYLLGTVRATDYGEEYLYSKAKMKNLTPWENFRNIGNLNSIDSLKIDSNKVKIIVKDNFNVSYIIKSEIINNIILRK